LAALYVADVSVRTVEREDPGRSTGIDHPRDRVMPRILLRGGPRPLRVLRVGILDHPVSGVAAANACGLHAARCGEIRRAEAHPLHPRAGGGDLLEVDDAEAGLEDRVD